MVRGRQMCGISMKCQKSSEELSQRLQTKCLAQVLRINRLRWFGHVEKKNDVHWVKECQRLELPRSRCRFRAKNKWRQCVAENKRLLRV